MRNTFLLLWCGGAFVSSLVASSAFGQTWDVTSQFSTTVNPNGAWSYGWEAPTTAGASDSLPVASSFTLDVSQAPTLPQWIANASQFPQIWLNNTGSTAYGVAPGQISLHPDSSGDASVVRWTSPVNGEVSISSQFFPGDTGIMDVWVLDNGVQLYNNSDSGTFDQDENVSIGDVIDFAVDMGPNGYFSGNTPLAATITVVPEPASLAMFCLAGAGLTLRPRRATIATA
jgi:hypothetical protein